jgi:hypothetical protein
MKLRYKVLASRQAVPCRGRLRRPAIKRIVAALVEVMNLVAAIPFVANLHPRPKGSHRRKILNSELNRLCGCLEAAIALPPPRNTPAPSDE